MVPDSGRYTPPEAVSSGWAAVKAHQVSAVDSYGFGILVFEIFNGCTIGNEQIGQTKNIPSIMHQGYKRLLNKNPKARLSVSHFKDQGRRSGGFFETPLVRLSEGIESLGLKSDSERDQFLRYGIFNTVGDSADVLSVSLIMWQMISPKIIPLSKSFLSF